MLYLTGALILALAFVNGWTDAPNAIATAVTTRALSPRTAVLLCALCNLLGLLLGVWLAPALLSTIGGLATGLTAAEAEIATTAAMASCVLWAVIAWWFGIPTSESHGMLAGVIGGCAVFVGADALRASGAKLALLGLLLALGLGWALGSVLDRLLHRAYRNQPRIPSVAHIRRLQRLGAVAAACLHGAQDGQKFLGMLLLCGLCRTPWGATLPIALLLTCGTALGGFRIIKRVGALVPLTPLQGLAAEGGSVGTLLIATLLGIPVSTTHTKTAAILGAGGRRRMQSSSVLAMGAAWLATFPICGLLGYLFAYLLA